MKDHGRLSRRIHRDSADATSIGERDNVRNRGRIVPDGTEIWKIANQIRVLVTTVGPGVENTAAGTNVGQHGRVAENGDCRLGIKKDPRRVNAGGVGLCKNKSVLHEGGTGSGRGRGSGDARTESFGMTRAMTAVAIDAGKCVAIRTGNRGRRLHKCQSRRERRTDGQWSERRADVRRAAESE